MKSLIQARKAVAKGCFESKRSGAGMKGAEPEVHGLGLRGFRI